MIEIKAIHSQVGMLIEARNGGNWQTVQLTKYKSRNSPSVKQYSTCINPALDEQEYFESLDRKGIEYKRVKQ